MKKLLLFAVLCISAVAWGQKIPPAPNPPKLVNDLANLMSADQVKHLEDALVAFDDTSSIQIVVLTVSTLDGYEPIDYAVKLGRDWGIGNKKTNNGVILLISTEPDNRKVFIAPGYGLEGAIPDITAKQIVETNIIPNLKAGNYYRGISEGVTAIMEAARGEYKAPAGYANRGEGSGGGGIVIFIIMMVVILFLISRRGGGGGGVASRRGYHDGIPPIFWLGGGGGGSGGGFSGGGGGFGGFGGGSFGGGGAGGSW